MEENNNSHKYEGCGKCGHWHGGRGADSAGLVWFLGAVGGAVYYIQQADTFGAGALGVLKALVWPAMLVYELMGFLGL